MAPSVPFFSLKEQWQQLKPAVMPKLQALLDAQACVGGPAVAGFEEAFAAATKSDHAIGCNSGTDALWLALKALDLKPNSIVLTTPFSFIASSSEIYAHGAHPVFIDIEQDTLNISPQALATWLEEHAVQGEYGFTEKETGFPIAGILFVNIFGLCANVTQLRKVAEEYNLWMVEDAAQSVGAAHNGQSSGTLGDISTFSFYPTKNLGAAGDAGMVTTSNAQYAEQLRRLRNHGRHSHYHYEGYGLNSRLDAVQAVVLHEKLQVLPDLIARRQSIAQRYSDAFENIPGVQTPYDDGSHTYHQYTITIDEAVVGHNRDKIIELLSLDGIGTRIFYPDLLCDIPYLQTDARLYTQSRIARNTVASMVSLPIWPELSDDAVAQVIAAVTKALKHPHHTAAQPVESTHS
jgi:dTDP-4-amino-4,6-dideoxygalactose transaminase